MALGILQVLVLLRSSEAVFASDGKNIGKAARL